VDNTTESKTTDQNLYIRTVGYSGSHIRTDIYTAAYRTNYVIYTTFLRPLHICYTLHYIILYVRGLQPSLFITKTHKHFKLEFQIQKNYCSIVSVSRRTVYRLRQFDKWRVVWKFKQKTYSIYCRLYTMSTGDETLWIIVIECFNNISKISCLLADSGDAPRILEGPRTTQVENPDIMKLHSLYHPVTRDTVHVW